MSYSSRESSPKSSIESGTSSGGSSFPPRRVGVSSSGVGASRSLFGSERIPVPAAGGSLIICPVCDEGFSGVKSMFGHMKNHKNRGWKGAYPPPAFDYLSEFSEYQHLLVKPIDQQEAEEEEAAGGTIEQAPVPAPGGRGRRRFTVPDLNKSAAEEEYPLPDLNFPPTKFR